MKRFSIAGAIAAVVIATVYLSRAPRARSLRVAISAELCTSGAIAAACDPPVPGLSPKIRPLAA